MMIIMKKIYCLFFMLLSACATNYKGDELPDLKGQNADDVLSIMGHPISKRKEGNAQMWAYRQSNCSTLIFLDENDIVQYAEQRGQCALNEGEE